MEGLPRFDLFTSSASSVWEALERQSCKSRKRRKEPRLVIRMETELREREREREREICNSTCQCAVLAACTCPVRASSHRLQWTQLLLPLPVCLSPLLCTWALICNAKEGRTKFFVCFSFICQFFQLKEKGRLLSYLQL